MMEAILKPQMEYLLLLQNFREITGHCLDDFFLNITKCGEVTIPILLLSFVYWCVNKHTGIYMAWNLGLGLFCNQFLKLTACIYRPWIIDNRIKPLGDAVKMATGYSFPSGHTAISAAVWGGLAIKTWSRKYLSFIFILIALLVAFSRNYIGVHTPQDVIVSLFLAVFWFVVVNKVLNWVKNGKNRDIIIISTMTVLSLLLILYSEFKPYPIHYLNGQILVDPLKMSADTFPKVGFIYGLFLGWFLENRFIKFECEYKSWIYRIVAFIIGVAILCLISFELSPVWIFCFGKKFGLFVHCCLISLFITFIYPTMLSYFKKCTIDNK